LLIQSLCGVDEFALNEIGRIKALINRRALRAYRMTNYWPRFFKFGEERTVTSSVVPYTQSGKSSIDTFLRIHKNAPYVSASAVEYDFILTSSGATLVCGSLNPATAFVTYKAQFTDTYGDSTGETTSIPAEWFQYLAHGTYADYLRAEGQQEKAMAAEAEAEVLLQDELIRIDQQHQHQVVGSRIFTNANMQTRY